MTLNFKNRRARFFLAADLDTQAYLCEIIFIQHPSKIKMELLQQEKLCGANGTKNNLFLKYNI